MKKGLATSGDTAIRIRDYLLQGPAQQREGRHLGAVAGTLQPDGAARYVYGEITGYYLHWLASLNIATEDLRPAASWAVAWLERYLQGGAPPPTRIYLGHAEPDWRNQALFAFDLAMIAGGLARVQQRALVALPATLISDLQDWLLPFVDDDGLGTCRATSADVVLPRRWSTMGGAFTAKTASRILLLGSQWPLDAGLLAACPQHLRGISELAERNGLGMLHPTLYALEGCLLSADADPERLAAWFEQIVALQGPDGSLPESLQTPAVRRTDIIAQALRVAICLEARLQQPGRYRSASAALAGALLARVRDDGSVPFSSDGQADSNSWCAMFTEQALRLHAAHDAGHPLPFSAEALV